MRATVPGFSFRSLGVLCDTPSLDPLFGWHVQTEEERHVSSTARHHPEGVGAEDHGPLLLLPAAEELVHICSYSVGAL